MNERYDIILWNLKSNLYHAQILPHLFSSHHFVYDYTIMQWTWSMLSYAEEDQDGLRSPLIG